MSHYVVTVKKGTDIDTFYNDMETSGGSSSIPDREVTCLDRKPISRNTGYDLEDSEVDALLTDDRVLGVRSYDLLSNREIRPTWEQNSTRWDKSTNLNANDKNWGLKRCADGVQTTNWGSDSTTTLSGIVTTTSGGRNVDVVIVDGFLDITHPEFAVNPDGTGGSRVKQFNWLSLNPQVTGGAAGNYTYDAPTNNNNQNHGMHVAGTACGNTQGWARYSNIYNVSPYDNQLGTSLFDFIRVWHQTKEINPETGRRNPTVINNSWGSYWNTGTTTRSNVTSITFQGSEDFISNPTDSQLQDRGIVDFTATVINIAAYDAADVADLEELVDAGVIIVGASGNDNTVIDVEGGDNYDNQVRFGIGTRLEYHRGSSASSGSVAGVGGSHLSLCVGNISRFTTDQMSGTSNPGPRVEVYAPGTSIMSPTNGDAVTGGTVTTIADPRDANYLNFKISGTSMASPQISGLMACLLEQYPRMTMYDVNSYITENMPLGQITATTGDFTDTTSLQGGPNRYVKYKYERGMTGTQFPLVSNNSRKTTNGVKYPRPRTMVDRTIANVNNNNNLVLTLTTSSFTDGGAIPTDHKNAGGCGGSNNSPQLTWTVTGSHTQAASLRLECWDIDGGMGNSRDSYFRHWGVFNIPLSSGSLAENATWTGSEQVQTSDFGGGDNANGWGGPCPPSGTHQYRIQIYPVDSEGNQITSDVNTALLTFTST